MFPRTDKLYNAGRLVKNSGKHWRTELTIHSHKWKNLHEDNLCIQPIFGLTSGRPLSVAKESTCGEIGWISPWGEAPDALLAAVEDSGSNRSQTGRQPGTQHSFRWTLLAAIASQEVGRGGGVPIGISVHGKRQKVEDEWEESEAKTAGEW